MNRTLYAMLCIGMCCCIPGFLIAQPIANFSANNTGGCAPMIVQFTDQSTGGATSWSWDLGNGATSTLQNPSTTYTASGSYTVTLTATNASGSNTKTSVSYITVSAPPLANFVADDSGSVCIPKTISFQNLSVSNTTGTSTYLWDFGDGTTSTSVNPVHTYTAAGNYNVTLVVTNANGCTKTFVKTGYIQAQAVPLSNFTSTTNIACSAPVSVSFSNTTSSATTYIWDFGDGSTSTAANPSHTYNTSGSYSVTLIANSANGCADTIVQPSFVVIGHPQASFTVSNTSACLGVPFSFSNTSVPASVNAQWIFGDGTTSTQASPAHNYTAAGTYIVKLVSSAGNCADTASQTVTVLPKPQVSFAAASTWGCTTPFTTLLQNNTANSSSQLWSFGDGTTSTLASPSHTYSTTGTHTVMLTVTGSNGCIDSLTKVNYITVGQPAATVMAVALAGSCIPAVYSFATSIMPSTTPSSFSYNYGDGTTGTSATHTYTAAGSYTVTYTYTLAAGCTYTATTTVTTGIRPTASFTALPLATCPATNVSFTNTSTGATSYLWLYGDGLTGTTATPLHSYEITGAATVTLIARSAGSCADTMIRPNYIAISLPHAQYTAAYTCTNNLQVNFTDNSNGADSWSWNFGDGATSVLQNPSHVYAAFGKDTVTLTVHNNVTGCNDTYISTITLAPTNTSTLLATDSNICKNKAIGFTVGNTTGITGYQWLFGDGTPASNTTTSTANHTYTVSGVYTVKVVLTNTHGCADTVVKNNYINIGGPVASFTAAQVSGCLPLNVQFTDQSSSPAQAGIMSRVWKYGDGGILAGNTVNPSHTYTTAGSFSVSLIVTDVNNCMDSTTRANYIQATKPQAQFSTDDTTVCTLMSVNFINASVGSNLSYVWSFGDGINSFATTPSHIYNTPGNYTVSLAVTDANGCKDTLTRASYIHTGSLAADFSINDSFATCPPLTVNCTNTTPGSNTYTWSFDNGGQSVLPNPNTVYTYPGVYHIKLMVHNASGCVDSAIRNIAVLGPTGTFSVSSFAGCSPLTVSLGVTNSSGATSYTWDMNNGVTQTTTATSFSYTYTQPGKYVPLVVISNGTCEVPIVSDTVISDHLNADFSFPAATYCTPAPVNFTDTSWGSLSNISSRIWIFGDGGTASTHNPSHTYTSGGTYQVRLIIGNISGCTDTITKTVTIGQKPAVAITGNQTICPGQTTPVTLTATGADTYVWTPGTGLACATCANTTVSPTATTTYSIVGSNINGCKDTATATVVVNTLPVVSAGPDQTICASHPAQLNATGAVTYVWSPAAGLSCTACASPVASPAVTTAYTVTGEGTSGCTATSQVMVNVNSIPASSLDSSENMCTGSSIILPGTAAGATSYLWYPADGLSCTTCATPIANPSVTTRYTMVTQGGNGCNDTGRVVVIVNPLPVVTVPSPNVCAGMPIQVTAAGAQNYVWYPDTGLSCSNCAAPFVNINASTAYTITGTDANGCTDSASIMLTVENRVPTSVGGTDSMCQGANVQLSATGGQSYTWTPADGLSDPHSANPIATPGYSTVYTVYIKENDCFTDTASQAITVYPLPSVSVGQDQTILDGQTVQLYIKSSLDVVSFSWSPTDGLSCADCQIPSATPQKSTTYTVTVTGQGGCQESAKTTVYLKCQNGQVFIPNIFTPNGDGANDRFYVSGKNIINVKRFSVYNRWGEAVYEAVNVPVNDPSYGWDGKYKGQLLKSDVFVYAITVVCETGELLDYKGDVTLAQ